MGLSVTDLARASASDNIRPEHTMSLHPFFNFDVPRNITTRVGQTTFLPCRVEQLGDKSVSSMTRIFIFIALNERKCPKCKSYHFLFWKSAENEVIVDTWKNKDFSKLVSELQNFKSVKMTESSRITMKARRDYFFLLL